MYHILSDGTPEEILTRIFRVFDINSDGVISIKEMRRLVKDMNKLCGEKDPTKVVRVGKCMIYNNSFRPPRR